MTTSPGRFDMYDKTVLITGAAGGIGSSLARGFAEAGAALALSDIREEKLAGVAANLLDDGFAVHTFPADLSQANTCTKLLDEIHESLEVDVLINSLTYNVRRPILDITEEDYEKVLSVNQRAPYFLSRAAAQHMIARKSGGRIIHISSVNQEYGLAGVSIYGMAKAALAQLVKVQAVEWAPHNILTNCIAPGFIKTELTEPLVADPIRHAWILEHTPLGRLGEPHELQGLALLLASEAGSFITGKTFSVDGGFPGSDWTKPPK